MIPSLLRKAACVIVLLSPLLTLHAAPYRVLAAGDSNTMGVGNPGGTGDARLVVGYRKALKEILAASGIEIDFQGSQSSGTGSGLNDPEHEGYPGEGLGKIQSRVSQGMIEAYQPDVVLLLVGSNDLWNSLANRTPISDDAARDRVQAITRIVDDIHARRPQAHIIVGLPATPGNTPQPLSIYRSGIEQLVANRRSQNRRVSSMDAMGAENDGVHYTPNGHTELGRRWASAIRAVIGSVAVPAPLPQPAPLSPPEPPKPAPLPTPPPPVVVEQPGRPETPRPVLEAGLPRGAYRALNFIGPSVAVGSRHWIGNDARRFSYSGLSFQLPASLRLAPAAGPRTAILNSGIFSPGGSNVTLTDVPNGLYRVTLYIVEDTGPRRADFKVNGQLVKRGVSTGRAGSWKKITFPARTTDQRIRIECNGPIKFSGVEIVRR